ncbi:hypothetical protein HYZ97_00090 [Candidatus Pacearchaeota archaeon]|nr:hypothetical protein [Candidatus Pacearchaeota archaeon]
MNVKEALVALRKEKKRNFEQSVDLLISLKGIDLKRDSVTAIINLPHQVREKRVCAFLSKKSSLVPTITNLDFAKYKDKKELKNLVKKYDFFIAEAKLMPQVATVFGKALGPTGKMPSPQLGVLMQDDEAALKALLARIAQAIKIRAREPSIKISVGKENMSDEQILANAEAVYHGVINVLPIKKDNVRSVMLKLTMSAPLKVEMK